MSRRSRRHRKVAARKTENLRQDLLLARERRQYDRSRQFDLPPSIMEMSDDFTGDYQETYSRVDGRPASVVQLPTNRNNVRLRESHLQEAVHAYFQDSPQLVSECQRRSRRRSVLFALRRTHKGSGRGKEHKWTEMSKVRCV